MRRYKWLIIDGSGVEPSKKGEKTGAGSPLFVEINFCG